MAQSQQTNAEDYLSQSVEPAEEKDTAWKEKGEAGIKNVWIILKMEI